MPQIRDNPIQSSILIRDQAEKEGGRPNGVNRKLVGRDCFREVVNHGRLFSEFVHDNFVYIRGREEDISRLQVCQTVRPTNNSGEGCVEHTRMDDLAFIVQVFQTFQNIFRQAQDKSNRDSWILEFTLKTRNAVAEHVGDKADVFANETLKCELVQEMDDVFEPAMERRRICHFSKKFAFSKPSRLDFP